jgi:drug/metabolite transporter (DMT)-like permease
MLADLAPGIVAALGFGASNVFGKIAFAAGADVLTLVTFRGLVGIAFVWAWLRFSPPARLHAPRARWVSLGLGVLFAANVYCVFKAIEIVPVPIAVLAYFIYPLLTGIGGAITGLDKLSWRGALAAIVAFAGLALMIGAHPGDLAFAGIAFAFGGAACRTAMLLITKAQLEGADSRLTSCYSLVSSTAVLAAICLATQTWNLPQTLAGWAGFLGTSVATTIAILALFASTARIGPFRTALTMNLEPVVSTILSMALLGESLGAVQWLGAAIMIAALCAFQLKR